MATAAPSSAWHYPPDLLELVGGAVARLNRRKEQELDFLRGAGVPDWIHHAVERVLARNAEEARLPERLVRVLSPCADAG
jgi:hypothetical protein